MKRFVAFPVAVEDKIAKTKCFASTFFEKTNNEHETKAKPLKMLKIKMKEIFRKGWHEVFPCYSRGLCEGGWRLAFCYLMIEKKTDSSTDRSSSIGLILSTSTLIFPADCPAFPLRYGIPTPPLASGKGKGFRGLHPPSYGNSG